MISKTAYCALLLGCSMAASARGADVLTVDKTQYEGHFLGLEEGKFLFRTKDGKSLSEPQGGVSSLKLEKPRQAVLVRAGKSKPEDAEILGYSKPQFSIGQDGRESKTFSSRLRSIQVQGVFDGREGGAPAAPDAGDVRIDIAALESGPELSQAQQDALAGYKDTRAQFDSFVEESTRLVQEMDATTGGRREELLNTLRLRKNEEQPLRRALKQALDALLQAFPEIEVATAPPPAVPATNPHE